MTKPPSTRHTVMPMSLAKPISVSSVQPPCTIVSGSARKVLLTKPPNVAAAHTRDEDDEEGHAEHDARARRDRQASKRLHLMKRVSASLRQVGHLLDDARLQQQVGGFLAERRVLAGEELLVRRAVLPAQVLLRSLEGSPLCLTSAPMISKLFFGSALIISTASK